MEVDRLAVGSVAAVVGLLLLFVCNLAVKAQRRKVTTGREGLVGKEGMVKVDFKTKEREGVDYGKISVRGEIWKAKLSEKSDCLCQKKMTNYFYYLYFQKRLEVSQK